MNMVVQKQIDHVPHHLFTQRPCSNPTLMPHFKSKLQSLRVTVVLHLCSFTLNSLVRNSYCISKCIWNLACMASNWAKAQSAFQPTME